MIKSLAFWVGFVSLLSPIVPSNASEPCEIPNYTKDQEAWGKVEKLKLASLQEKNVRKVSAAYSSCTLEDLRSGGDNGDTCRFVEDAELWPGKAVIILREDEKFACVTAARGMLEAFWVKKENLDISVSKDFSNVKWSGAYRHGPSVLYPGYSYDEIDIQNLPSGKLQLSGGLIWEAGEIPSRKGRPGSGCGFFTLSQIDFQDVDPSELPLKLKHVRVGIFSSNCPTIDEMNNKASSDEVNDNGRKLSECNILLKKNGPFLFVRENENCNQFQSVQESVPVGFGGIWVENPDEHPSPRKDHALNMQLGR